MWSEINTQTNDHKHVYIYIHTYMHACMHAYIPTYIQTDRQTDRHTQLYTFWCPWSAAALPWGHFCSDTKFGPEVDTFKRRRAAELKHGRICALELTGTDWNEKTSSKQRSLRDLIKLDQIISFIPIHSADLRFLMISWFLPDLDV